MHHEESVNPFTEAKDIMAMAEISFEETARKVTRLGMVAPDIGQKMTPFLLADQDYEAYLNIRNSLTELSSELIATGREINAIFHPVDGILSRAMDFVTTPENVVEIHNHQRHRGDDTPLGVIIGSIMQTQGLEETYGDDFQVIFNCASALYEDGLDAQLTADRHASEGIEPEHEDDGDIEGTED